jgi:hypothetical protein
MRILTLAGSNQNLIVDKEVQRCIPTAWKLIL